MLYDEYSSRDVWQDADTLVISLKRKEGDSFGYESLQDITSFLHLALVDCETYRFGHGIKGCVIKESAPYKFVEVRMLLPTDVLLTSVRYTVGNKSYFSGYDGTQIITSDVFDLADKYYVQDESILKATGKIGE
jgi:hypothetical protein